MATNRRLRAMQINTSETRCFSVDGNRAAQAGLQRLESDNDFPDLSVALQVFVGVDNVSKGKHAVYLRLERSVGEPAIDVPLHGLPTRAARSSLA